MKKIINFTLIILFASLTYAITIGNPIPTITTTFNEPVMVTSISATLTDNQNGIFVIENTFISQDNKTVKHRPIDYLQEGAYIFSIQAQDIYGNFGDLQTQSFTVDVPPLSMILIIPSFGVSSTEIFNLNIKTSLPSECRYSQLSNTNYENMIAFFETINNTLHTITGFDMGADNWPQDGKIYVACKTSYDNSTAYDSFQISIDPTQPVITSISANAITQQPIETTIQLTTDDKTICKYSKENIPYSNMTFFSSSDESLQTSYSTSHAQQLSSSKLEDYTINQFYIICKNLAELFSETKTISIEVDTSADATITINNPQQGSYHPISSIVLDISTNKLAICYFSNNSENIFEGGGTFGGPSGIYEHISSPLFLGPGTHTSYFKCFVDPPAGALPISSTTFTIDTTPPVMLFVDDSNTVPGMKDLKEFTYYTDKLHVEWAGEDNETGIEVYEYILFKDNGYSPDDVVRNWTQIEPGADDTGGGCKNDCNFNKGKCNDNCKEFKEECEDSCIITKDFCKESCEGEDDEYTCKNECETNLGECNFGCNDELIFCGTDCSNEKQDCLNICSSEQKVVKNLNLDPNGTYYFKFKAKNMAGLWGQEKSSNGITVNTDLIFMGTCNNGVQDFDETDIDCGGLCDNCALNQSCDVAEDCLSNYCNPSKKCDNFIIAATCLDGTKNQYETDIDCGGNCSKCTTGKSCSINSDCLSNNCDPNMRLCIIQDTCTNNVLDDGETDIDCGGNCLPCNNGNICLLDSDCISNYCSEKTNVCLEFTLCGNGVIDPGEQCENSTDEKTCNLFGLEEGTLSCGDDCLFNTSLCMGENGTCGDNIINPGEQCEGSNRGTVKGCFDFDDFESGKLDCKECILKTNQCSKEVDPKQDTDKDGMSDICELKYFKHRTKAKPNEDPDEDGLTNKEECNLCHGSGTNPKKEDTDGDGYTDKKEDEKGTDPCDPEDFPESTLFLLFLIIIIISLLLGGAGYYIYSRKIVSFLSKPPYVLFSKPIQPPPKFKGPGMIEFIKTPPYLKLNADISFTNKPPFIIIKSTLPPPQIQQQLVQPIIKGPGMIEFIKTPPYLKLNADISFTNKPPFIIIKSTLPPPQIPQQPTTQPTQPTQARQMMRAPVRTIRPVRQHVIPRKKAQPVGLVIKKRKRRKVLDTFKTENKEEKDKKDKDNE